MTQKHVSYDLDALLTAQEQGVELLHPSPLDRAIVAGKYEEALKLWEEMEVGAPEDAAKAGFASWMQTGSCKDLLTLSNVGSHPTAGAAVALSLYAQAMAKTIEERVMTGDFKAVHAPRKAYELLESVCQAEKPSIKAMTVLLDLWAEGDSREHRRGRRLELATTAAALYPHGPDRSHVDARERRLAGELDDATAARPRQALRRDYAPLVQ